MRIRILTAVALAMLAPATMFAAKPMRADAVTTEPTAVAFQGVSGDDCGHGNAWGCRRNRGDERYDDRRDRDRHDRDRYDNDRSDRDRYERARWERDRYDRDQYARERYAREQYERERYERARYEREREEWRYRNRDRRYSRYDGRAVACVQAGGRILGSAVLVICVP
jgi:hypothetical protein